ncbi:hypothetical protein VTO42DRAFT_2137 [Malbranchea cinnamomea]
MTPSDLGRSPSPAQSVEQPEDMPQVLRLGKLLVDAFETVGGSSQAGLESSRWATITQGNTRAQTFQGSREQGNGASTLPAEPAAEPAAGSKLADASSFMAAVRNRIASASLPDAKEAIVAQGDGIDETNPNAPSSASKTASVTPLNNASTLDNGISRPLGLAPQNAPAAILSPNHAKTSHKEAAAPEEEEEGEKEEDRENQHYFKTWGPVAPRSTPRSETRKVILKNIPPWLSAPDKIFSLIHGGQVESMSILPSGTVAQVVFCDAAACRRYYDMYPNGLEVNHNGRTAVIFVDMDSREPDVMSSRIREAIEKGSSRVVRAIGADLNLSMVNMINLAEGNNLKLEKITDIYVPSTQVRTVRFRFCSIDHALRFRATLTRLDEWEQANVQFVTDPCEVANGFHWD